MRERHLSVYRILSTLETVYEFKYPSALSKIARNLQRIHVSTHTFPCIVIIMIIETQLGITLTPKEEGVTLRSSPVNFN